jgi:DmsE family decaheme c-type cytochrome
MVRPLSLLLFLFVTLAALPLRAADEGDAANAASPNACLRCHDEPKVNGVLHTAHMVAADARTGASELGCQNCHGDSTAHVARIGPRAVRPPPERVFSGQRTSPVDVRNAACLGCHQAGAAMHWQGSQHAASDVACSSCHASHQVRDAVLAKDTQPRVCFGCHADRRADALKPSHHPVLEGRMACGDCHNAHGSVGPNLLRAATVNDTCLDCHDEKRGPFLFEHAPVREQCTICHTPHGSVQASLLRQRAPYLCQDCHDSSTHNSQPFSGSNLPGGPVPGRQLVLRGCLNCHSAVHGSNHPSGVRLSR